MRSALIIANTEYADPGLAQLTAPGNDAKDFARVLKDQEICAFDEVNLILNQPEYIVRGAIDEFFDQKKPDDLLVLYFSGHGVRDELGSLYLAVKNTIRTRLRSTAIKSDYIREAMDQSRSKRQVLILDCCNSGAFAQGTKAATGASIGTATAFEAGYGRVILTASDSTQFAWEGDKVIGETDNSLFTHYLVKGLEGEADLDGDGCITVDELYDYAYERVKLATPKQTPSKFSTKQQGEIILRQITRLEDIKPVPLPTALLDSIENPFPDIRLGAVQQLIKLLNSKNLGLARSAREALEHIEHEDDSRAVTRAAFQALESIRQAQQLTLQKAEEGCLEAETVAVGQKVEEKAEVDHETVVMMPKQQTARKPQFSWRKYAPFGFAVIGLMIIVGIWRISSYRSTISSLSTPNTDILPSNQGTGLEVSPTAVELTPTASSSTPLPLALSRITLENAANVKQLARWGKGTIDQLTYSPDGKILAVASSLGIYLYDSGSLNQIRYIDTDSWISSIAFSPDGKMLASAPYSKDTNIRLWRVSDGTLIKTFRGHTNWVMSVAFSPDGQVLASGSLDNTVRLWRISDESLIKTLEGHTSSVFSVAFSPDGQILASGSYDNTIKLWQVTNGTLINTLGGQTDAVLNVAFSPDGQIIASASNDNNIRLWNVSTGLLTKTLNGHLNTVYSVAFSPDGKTLASGSYDKTVKLWNVNEGTLIKTLEGHSSYIESVAFSPDGQMLASGSSGAIELWQVRDGTLVKMLEEFSGAINSLAFSPDGQLLVFGSGDNTIRIRHVSDGILVKTLEGHADNISSVAFSPDGKMLASASVDNTIRLWQIGGGALIRILEGHTSYVQSVVFSPDGQMVVSGSNDKTVRLWRVSDGMLLRTLEGHTDTVDCVAFSPDGKLIASGSWDHTVRLWQVSDGTLIKTLKVDTDLVHSVAFSPDGQMLASSLFGGINLWRVADGTLVNTFDVSAGDVLSVAFSPDGRIIAFTPGSYGQVYLWNITDGMQIKILKGHTSWINSVVFSPDSALIATGSEDGTIRLWGLEP